MGNCEVEGGCASDYVAVSIAAASMVLLLIRSAFPCLVRKVPCTNGSAFWLLCIQVFASFNFLLSIMIANNYLRFERTHWWQSCYLWADWVGGPLGFGLLMSCRIVQALKLYYLFVKRRLPPIRTYVLLPLILLPWIGAAAPPHIRKPENSRCHVQSQWVIPVCSLYISYVAVMVGITQAVRHIEFKFHEFKDLLRGIFASTVVIVIWIASYIMNEVRSHNASVQLTSRFLSLVMASILVLAFYSISISQPLLTQMSLRRKDSHEVEMMGQALGIPDSGLLLQRSPVTEIDTNEPLDKLLANKKFRQSFMAFADSCLAGESVHFYDEVYELSKIPANDPVSRVYMTCHIIEKYIVSVRLSFFDQDMGYASVSPNCQPNCIASQLQESVFNFSRPGLLIDTVVSNLCPLVLTQLLKGGLMEVNISHRTRQEILGSLDLAHPNLFNKAVNELMQLMKTNLAKDYWSSVFFLKFKEESIKQSDNHEYIERMVAWEYSPRPSCVHCVDDPFHQEHQVNGSGRRSAIDENGVR